MVEAPIKPKAPGLAMSGSSAASKAQRFAGAGLDVVDMAERNDLFVDCPCLSRRTD